MTRAKASDQRLEPCRVLEHRQVALDDGTHGAGAILRLPAADVESLVEQGFVEPLEESEPEPA